MVDLATPSIRQRILSELVVRLQAIEGWEVQLRSTSNEHLEASVSAVVHLTGEDKTLANNQMYSARMQVGVELAVFPEAMVAADGGNLMLALDRCICAVEQVMHVPDQWDVDPDFTTVRVTGHAIAPPQDGELSALAVVQMEFQYRHSIETPQS